MVKLFLIRKIKSNFIRFKLHALVEPLANVSLNLAYLSKISKWVRQQKPIKHNDFYSHKWDYNKRYNLYKFLLEEEKLTGRINYLEFGVSHGHSFKWWAEHNKNADSRFYGFDTFTGLPENWGHFDAGAMAAPIPDMNDSRANFIKGLFQETLPGFLKKFDNTARSIIHLDADLYSSTLYVLTKMSDFLKKDDILIFDEFNVPQHEFLAFLNFTNSYYIKLELIAAANNYYFVAFKVK